MRQMPTTARSAIKALPPHPISSGVDIDRLMEAVALSLRLAYGG